MKLDRSNLGLDLAVLGAIISCLGVFANNILLDHILAMQIWMFSNPVLMLWAIGNWRRWWDGGLSGLALTGMYVIFTVTNLIGLMSI